MNRDLAPIILFIYNRPVHTKKVLEALQKNIYAAESVLYVFADGPKDNATVEDLNAITLARSVVNEVSCCKEVILVAREKNMNLDENVIDGISTVINKHKKAIILEDDLITSPYFLKYCNDGLDMYENDKNVFSINGFMFPVNYDNPEPATFLCPLATNSWGWATWADRWEKFEYSPLYIDAIEKHVLLSNRFNFGTITYFQILKHLNTWDLRWYYSAYSRNGLGLFPTKSLVRNLGFDGSGTHESFGNIGDEIYESAISLVYQSAINLNLYGQFLHHFRPIRDSNFQKIKNAIKKLINYKNYNVWWNVPGQRLY